MGLKGWDLCNIKGQKIGLIKKEKSGINKNKKKHMNYKDIACRGTRISSILKNNFFLFEQSRFNKKKLMPRLSVTKTEDFNQLDSQSTERTKKVMTIDDSSSHQQESPSFTSPTVKEGDVNHKRPIFPFTAIVGQEEMKLALLLNVIDPKIGGVMIMGDRGTGKSTTVRALVDLLPNIEVIDNDPFNSHPSDAELMSQNVREQVLQGKSLKVVSKKTAMIDLPLGATEDRVCGTIDIEKALSEGIKAFEPGLLAKANRGILYVDEVNLLDDHLVDILLDSAASGWNTVEREGISVSHPARFILVGSGNPEEGELRPQLLDRFGMHAQIGTVREAELRVKIVEERACFDQSPVEFLKIHAEKQKQLAEKIVAARHLLGAVKIDYDLRVKISQVCGQLNVDGLRGDIVTNRASQALAALETRTNVTPEDIFRVIPLCLRHRLRKDPLEPIDSGDKVRETFKQVFGLF